MHRVPTSRPAASVAGAHAAPSRSALGVDEPPPRRVAEEPCGAVAVAPGVHWVGALDPGLRCFDLILNTGSGTTYNSFVVRGESGVAVIDTVKAEFADDFFRRLETVARYEEIRVIVLNHLEPDHTGALPELMRRAPQAELCISKRAPALLNALLKVSGDRVPAIRTLDTGDTIDLGGQTLQCLHTPFLHWPDTQCTWLAEAGVLFSGDIFGSHHCDERLFDDVCGEFHCAFDDYFAHIMRPFKRHVRAALELIEPLPIALIAPTHGPILRERPQVYVQRYRELATTRPIPPLDPDQPGLVILYASAHGGTARMAAAIRDGLEEGSGISVVLHELGCGDPRDAVDLIECADVLVIGSPTINGDAAKAIWDLLASLSLIDLNGKLAAAFGSYGWSGEAVRLIEERLRGLKLRVPVPGLRQKLIPNEAELVECRAFGRALANALNGAGAGSVIDFADLQ
ncbi:MBL fold metallo-hydrolase [Thiocapsa imhoffii]|uniref:MBL fold metallo-hydrolase n=1 Tax=Thiocapsa imhoffii TaxID=382777 RepID=A0A9X0WIU7_9GAMM|nr:FprA family A-type flavoprotein [Thiocapsa imhoffii]MBK1645524.1 MBL fold metallo-hydrolase [Thiocapsa imhoffii]